MLKVFGSCLPEYQIMLVCSFIFFNSTVHGSGHLRGNMGKTKKGDAAG